MKRYRIIHVHGLYFQYHYMKQRLSARFSECVEVFHRIMGGKTYAEFRVAL